MKRKTRNFEPKQSWSPPSQEQVDEFIAKSGKEAGQRIVRIINQLVFGQPTVPPSPPLPIVPSQVRWDDPPTYELRAHSSTCMYGGFCELCTLQRNAPRIQHHRTLPNGNTERIPSPSKPCCLDETCSACIAFRTC